MSERLVVGRVAFGPSSADRSDDLAALVRRSSAAFEAMSPVEKALHLADQKRSLARGLSGRDPGEDALAVEVRRLRDQVEGMQAVVAAAAAWRSAVQAADDALGHAADVAQGIEPGSKRDAHAAATAAEDAALIARAAYDEAAGTLTHRSTT